jgi:transposase
VLAAGPLGRNLRHLITLLDDLQALGIWFVTLGEGIATTTPAGRLQLHVLSAVSQFERDRIAERIRAGLAPVVAPVVASARRARGKKTGPNPTDRRKAGSKHHLVTDARSVPLVAQVTAANVNDITLLDPLVAALPAVRGRRGRPRRRPDALQGDRGYDSQPHRDRLFAQGIVPILAPRRTPNGSGLGVCRWVVERTHAWLHRYRRLAVRYERRDDVHQAVLTLGCILVGWNYLKAKKRVF